MGNYGKWIHPIQYHGRGRFHTPVCPSRIGIFSENLLQQILSENIYYYSSVSENVILISSVIANVVKQSVSFMHENQIWSYNQATEYHREDGLLRPPEADSQ